VRLGGREGRGKQAGRGKQRNWRCWATCVWKRRGRFEHTSMSFNQRCAFCVEHGAPHSLAPFNSPVADSLVSAWWWWWVSVMLTWHCRWVLTDLYPTGTCLMVRFTFRRWQTYPKYTHNHLTPRLLYPSMAFGQTTLRHPATWARVPRQALHPQSPVTHSCTPKTRRAPVQSSCTVERPQKSQTATQSPCGRSSRR